MEIYLVGGAVRDALLGYPSSERDWVVVGASPADMLDNGYQQVGRDFPVFLHPQTKDEYALARTERKQGLIHLPVVHTLNQLVDGFRLIPIWRARSSQRPRGRSRKSDSRRRF